MVALLVNVVLCRRSMFGREFMMTERRWRYQIRHTARNDEGKSVIGFGLRVGYWPCLRAPFLQISMGVYNLDIWWGGPSKNVNHETFSYRIPS